MEGWRAITFYQLGATLHDLLVRKSIFEDYKEPAARLYRAVKEHVPLIEAEDADPWLVDLARRCLHKDWRVRKELVTWDDFKGPRPPAESGQQIRERLKKRIDVGRTVAPLIGDPSDSRPTRRTMEQLAGSIATISREICQQGGVFPAVEVQHFVEGDACVVTINTGPSIPLELDGVLTFRLTVEPLDVQAKHVRVTEAVRLGAVPVSADSSPPLFVGEPSSSALRDILDTYFHAALERALGTGTPPFGGLAVHPDLKET